MPTLTRVRRFVLMHKEFDADEAELTRTRKLKRNVLVERYASILDGMYAGEALIEVRAPVRYQDGREGFVETAISVMNME